MEGFNLTSLGPGVDSIIYSLIAIGSLVFIALTCKCCCGIWRRSRERSSDYLVEDGSSGRRRPLYSPPDPSPTVWTTSNETVRTHQYARPYATPWSQHSVPSSTVNRQGLGAVAGVTSTSTAVRGYHHRLVDDSETAHARVSATSSNYNQNWQPQASRLNLTLRPIAFVRPVPSPPSQFTSLQPIHPNPLNKFSSVQPKLLVCTRRTLNTVPRFKQKLCSLTIATDATPDKVGGYCIDFSTKTCEYYSFPTSVLPKCLTVIRHFNSAEFEMNNLAFALLHWEPLILERQRLHVYTDNNSIREKGIKPEHGKKVRAYLDHLEKCEGVKLLNRRMHHVNRKTRAGDFEKYIVPADDLSRASVDAFKAKIRKSFPKIGVFSELDTISLAAREVRILIILPVPTHASSCPIFDEI